MKIERRYRRGLFWPLILIAIGAAFLLNNLGLLGPNAWDTLVRFWPVILIAFGLDHLVRRRGLVGPVFFIGLGTLFLLSNFNLLEGVWWSAIQYWPILLIAIGVDILLGHRSTWLSLLGLCLVLVILAGSIWLSGQVQLGGQSLTTETIAQPLGEATQARITLKPSVASLKLKASTDPETLISGEIQVWPVETLKRDASLERGLAAFTLESKAKNIPFNKFKNYSPVWDLALNAEVPMELNVELGVGKSSLDLQGIHLQELTLSTGVGETELHLPPGTYLAQIDAGVGWTKVVLPSEGVIQLSIDGGVGDILILIPKGMEARLSIDRGLSSLHVPEGYAKQGEVYLSPGYNTSTNRVEIDIDQGIGNVTIQEQ
jgi:hypothetical protein